MEPFVKVEDDIRLAIEIASERMSLTGPEFAAKLQLLIETCRLQGHRAAQSHVRIELHPISPTDSIGSIKSDTLIPGAPPAKPLGPVVVKVPTELKDDPTLKLRPSPIPKITPMRTREDALAAHRAKHPELYNEDGTRKSTAPNYDPAKLGRQELHGEITDEDLDELERATRPDPPKSAEQKGYKFKDPETGRVRKIDDAGREDIRRRAKQARLDNMGKHPRGWLKRIAAEYGVSDALIYNIIYTDPSYEAVAKA